MSATADSVLAVECDRPPCRSPSTWRSGARAWVKAPRDSTQASSGMLPVEVSVSGPPIVTPHRPRLIEYVAPEGGTGRPRCCR